MFGTWKLDSEQEEPQLVRYANAASAMSKSSWNCHHIACDTCRLRKLRCSGEPTGCKRCISMRIGCTYPSALETRRRKRTNQSADAQQSSKPSLGPRKASGTTATSQHAPGPADQSMKDDGMEEYRQNPLDNWLASTDSSTASSQKGVTTPAQDWSDMLNDLDDFTDAWSDLPSGILSSDELPTSLQISTNDSSTTPADQVPAPILFQVQGSSAGLPATTLGPTDFDVESPLPGRTGDTLPQSASSSTSRTQARSRPLANVYDLPVHDPDANDGSGGGSCHCLKLAACLLEELSTQIACVMTTMMDELLSQYQAVARQSSHILRCVKCASRSENMMLLAMISQHICTICENMAYRCLHRSGSVDEDMWFGSFKIKAGSEKNQLLKSLILLQLRDFCSLLERMKVRAASLKVQTALLEEAERKVQKLAWLIKQSNRSKESTDLL